MNYPKFIENLDKKLQGYFWEYKDYINCKKGCSFCCQKGDYPISELEFKYIMLGYMETAEEVKSKIKHNIEQMQEGEKCPFLVNNICSVYKYRPLVCRVHGLAYKGNKYVILPYCTNEKKNYHRVYNNNILNIEPIKENLDTPNLLKDFDYGEIRTMYNWLKIK